jgi:hypothetical protein
MKTITILAALALTGCGLQPSRAEPVLGGKRQHTEHGADGLPGSAHELPGSLSGDLVTDTLYF